MSPQMFFFKFSSHHAPFILAFPKYNNWEGFAALWLELN